MSVHEDRRLPPGEESAERSMARRVAVEVSKAGGRCFYVGGCVRDRLLGLENKDIDVEVHGVSYARLEAILRQLGEPLTKGASFGVMGLRGYDLDVAMPRLETATGRGHRDFEIFVDPFLGEEKAARRRDFTINAMMEDVLSGELLDFFGGREDLARGIIRHVDDGSYLEDPLRVLRAAQFAARFDFAVAEETAALSAKADLTALAGERVMAELEKALMKARAPSRFFVELRRIGQLSDWFPELASLIGLPQNPVFHPEGDVWTHTMQVLDAAARLRERAIEPLWFMLAALCHDFGKALTTRELNGVLHAYAHETEGLPLVQTFLARLTGEGKLREYVLNLVRLHMKPNRMVHDRAGVQSFMKLFDACVCPEDLILLSEADVLGCLGRGEDAQAARDSCAETGQALRGMLAEYRARMALPYVMGRDLLEAGAEPGPDFSGALDCAHKLRLAGRPKKEQLSAALAYLRQARKTR